MLTSEKCTYMWETFLNPRVMSRLSKNSVLVRAYAFPNLERVRKLWCRRLEDEIRLASWHAKFYKALLLCHDEASV
jgi:hypothetical protein